MMKKAIEVMRLSIGESRNDGKSPPRVGAVLIKPGPSPLQTAYRGELREGDHAEYTLLERKNRDKPLDGSVLFTTLEPCAPGARNHPKMSCAERIVLARIKEVWVGIEDPDPTVDRKGIKHLQDHGVTVYMFDREFQEEIREFNKDFIAQALERKAAADEDEGGKPVTLSSLENSVATADLRDFAEDALKLYRSFEKFPKQSGSEEFHRRLVQQGLLRQEGKKLVPAGFGLLLFGKSPRAVLPQAGLLGTIHDAGGQEEIRDFDGPMVSTPDEAIRWLKDKLPNPIDRSNARRKNSADSFFELVREGIVNALVHRNYDITGAKCQLIVTPDTIVVKSPGGPIEPITLEQLQSFNAPMLSRNPVLHYVFAKMELAEERGLGLKSMKNRAEEIGLPLPKYSWEAPYLVLTLYRSREGVTHTLPSEVLASLNEDERDAWEFLNYRSSATSAELQTHAGFDERKTQRILKKLVDVKLIRRVGKGPSTRYEVAQV